jgi:hypothetical protein
MGSGNELTRVGFKAQPVDKDDRLAFVAAATTIGFELCEGTPKVSNVYDQGHPFEPGQPGDVRMYLPQLANDININEFIEVWRKTGKNWLRSCTHFSRSTYLPSSLT